MQKYFDFVQDQLGNALGGASIFVQTTAGAMATIYSDNSGTALGNPFNTQGNGYFEFYAANGRYNITVSKTGFNIEPIADVILNDSVTPTYIASAGGTADALTATFNVSSYIDGLEVYVVALSANATTTPTFTITGLAAKTIVKYGNQPLLDGDIYGSGHILHLIYRSGTDKFELMNPVYGISVLGPTKGGTGLSSYSPNNLIYASGTNTLATIVFNTNSTRYMSNQSGTPSWAQVDLTNGVTGTLAVANGGIANPYFSVSGLGTTTRTFAFPDANTTVLTTNTQVTVIQGGSGRNNFNPYAIICGGTTTSAALQVVAFGTTSTFLMSQGTAALGTFVALPASGAIVKLTSGTTTTSQATIDIVLTAFTAYRNKIIRLTNAGCVSNTTIDMRVSTDGGSNYDAGAANYTYCNQLNNEAAIAVTVANSASATLLATTGGISAGGGVTEGCEVSVFIANGTNTAKAPRFRWDTTLRTSGSVIYDIRGSGQRAAAQDTDAVRFLPGTGNFLAGTFWDVYGET